MAGTASSLILLQLFFSLSFLAQSLASHSSQQKFFIALRITDQLITGQGTGNAQVDGAYVSLRGRVVHCVCVSDEMNVLDKRAFLG